jgi:hypothetical protein
MPVLMPAVDPISVSMEARAQSSAPIREDVSNVHVRSATLDTAVRFSLNHEAVLN